MRSRFLLSVSAALLLSPVLASAQRSQQKLYVLHSNADDMSVIDVATNELIGTVHVGPLPHGIAAPGSQDVVYVATEGEGGGLVMVDPYRDEVIRQYDGFGKRPNEIDVTSDGRLIYVPSYGDGVYEVFDRERERIVARIPTDGLPHNVVVSPDDRFAYFSAMDKGIRTVEQMQSAGLATSENEKIYVVSTSTHEVIRTIDTGNTPRPIALSPDGKRLFVNTDDLLGFVVLDLDKGKMVAKAEYDLTPEELAAASRAHGIGVTPDGREVWSTDINHGLVHVFDVTGDQPRQIARMETGRQPLWLAITPDGKTVYISNTADNTVSAFDAATKKEVARIQLREGTAPKRMLVVNVPMRQGAPMSFFITSSGPGDGANLGGLEGADAHCQMLANDAGAGDLNWRAYLSATATDAMPAVNARDRIGTGPWHNFKGEMIARDLDELHGDNHLTKETQLTEKGGVVNGRGDSPNQHDILTGSRLDGRAFQSGDDTTCSNWTSNGEGSAQVGHHDRNGGGPNPTSWGSAHGSRGCGQSDLQGTGGNGYFYCFGTAGDEARIEVRARPIER